MASRERLLSLLTHCNVPYVDCWRRLHVRHEMFVPTLSQHSGPRPSRTVPRDPGSCATTCSELVIWDPAGLRGIRLDTPDLPDNAEVASSILASPTTT
jgi:hypothetical protein